jgi:ribosomal protein L37AE/L43A
MVVLTAEAMEAARLASINEPGSEPPCPFCGRPRVRRSDYTRCNQCGTNWLDGEDLARDPRNARMRVIASAPMGTKSGAQTAESTSSR